MVIYEINTIVRNELIDQYEKYMTDTHIPDVLATGHFGGAYLSRAAEGVYAVHYFAHTQDAMKDYLQNHAPRLRSEIENFFPAGVEISRQTWKVLKHFDVEFRG